MSWRYWEIVAVLVITVEMLLTYLTLLSPTDKESLPTQSDNIDAPRTMPQRDLTSCC